MGSENGTDLRGLILQSEFIPLISSRQDDRSEIVIIYKLKSKDLHNTIGIYLQLLDIKMLKVKYMGGYKINGNIFGCLLFNQ